MDTSYYNHQELSAGSSFQQYTTTATRTHPRAKCPYPECRSSFSRAADLSRHLRSVHSQRLINCPWPRCERKGDSGFTREDHLREHRRDYHREKLPRKARKFSDIDKASEKQFQNTEDSNDSAASKRNRKKPIRNENSEHDKGALENVEVKIACPWFKIDPCACHECGAFAANNGEMHRLYSVSTRRILVIANSSRIISRSTFGLKDR